MNAKKAKALRKTLIPGRAETGISRGAFLRTLRKYDENFRKQFTLEFPMDDSGETPEPFTWITSTVTLDPNTPRGLYQRWKRKINGSRS